MPFHNNKIIIPVLFSVALIAVGMFAYTAGRTNAERNFFIHNSRAEEGASIRLAGGIIGTWGGEYIFYTTYCGSSCLGFEVINLTTGHRQRGSLSFLFDDNGDAYTVFWDWNGRYHKFDGEFVSVSGHEQGEKLFLDFVIKHNGATQSAVHSVEF